MATQENGRPIIICFQPGYLPPPTMIVDFSPTDYLTHIIGVDIHINFFLYRRVFDKLLVKGYPYSQLIIEEQIL